MSMSRLSFPCLLVLTLSLGLLLVSLPAARGCSQNTCRAGYAYELIPAFNFSTNGCGSYGVSVSAPFGADPCCRSHDFCYSFCNSTKTQCDSAFQQCLHTQCQADSGVDQDACDAQAVLFYDAVMDLGCPAYSSAQDQACECTNGTAAYLFTSSASQGRALLSGTLMMSWGVVLVMLWLVASDSL